MTKYSRGGRRTATWKLCALLVNFTDVVIWSEVTREIWEMMLLTLWPRLELGAALSVVRLGYSLSSPRFCSWMCDPRAFVVYGFACLSTILSSRCAVSVSASPWRVVHFVSTVTASLVLFVIVSEHAFSRWRALSCGVPCPYSRVGKTFLSILCDDSGEFWRCAPRVLLSCPVTMSKSW